MADPSHMSVSTMREDLDGWGVFYKLTWEHVLLVLAVLLSARLLSSLVRWALRHAAEKAPPRLRLAILRLIPLTRLVLGVGAVVVAVPILEHEARERDQAQDGEAQTGRSHPAPDPAHAPRARGRGRGCRGADPEHEARERDQAQ